MKLNKYILIGTMAVAGLSSCVSETIEDGSEKAGTGRMALDVSLLEPQSTRAESPVTNYPVTVYNAAGDVVKSYNTVADVPESEVLSVGNYVVESHTPGGIEKKMLYPYYFGTKDMEIKAGLTTDVKVVCRMQNSKITVTYDGKFFDAFETWSITLNDGSDMALSFTNEEGYKPNPVYWWFKEEDKVEELILNFRAVTVNGDNVAYATSIFKTNPSDMEQQYDDDKTYFTGGDAIVLKFTAVEDTKGNITGITVNATVTFTETDETIDLDVTDKGSFTPGGDDDNPNNPGDGDEDDPTPTPGDGKPSFDCPELETGVEFSVQDEKLPETNVIIHIPEGLESMKVTINAGNEDFKTMTEMFQDMEMINNLLLGDVFDTVEGVRLPENGDTLYEFPVYAFFSIIKDFGPTDPGKAHEFYIVVEDKKGNVIDATLKVTVTE